MDQIVATVLSALIAGCVAAVGATQAAKRSYRGQLESADRSSRATIAAAETAAVAATKAAELNQESARAVATLTLESQRQLEREKAIREYRTTIVRGFLDWADRRVLEYVKFAVAMSDTAVSNSDITSRFHQDLALRSVFLQGAALGAFASGSPIRTAADDLAVTENQWLKAVGELVGSAKRTSADLDPVMSYWSGQYTGRLDHFHRVAIEFIFAG